VHQHARRNVIPDMSALWGADDLEVAWIALNEANLRTRWVIGVPTYDPSAREWTVSAFDPRERPSGGQRVHEWTAHGTTEATCVRSMWRHLKEIGSISSRAA